MSRDVYKRQTIHIALKDMGIKRPYPLEGGVDNDDRSASRKRADNRVQEFVWAFGAETEEQIEKQILLQIEQLKEGGDVENLLHGRWSHMEAMDEDEWLEHLEEHLKEIVNLSLIHILISSLYLNYPDLAEMRRMYLALYSLCRIMV